MDTFIEINITLRLGDGCSLTLEKKVWIDDPDYFLSAEQIELFLTNCRRLRRRLSLHSFRLGAGPRETFGIFLGAPDVFDYALAPDRN